MKQNILVFYAILPTLVLFCLTPGCASMKQWAATGGSKADGIIKLSYEYNMYQRPRSDEKQGLKLAIQRCQRWGYIEAEAFGGETKTCTASSYGYGTGGCSLWLVTREYQCISNKSGTR